MKDWEMYEHQIFDKLNQLFPNTDIQKNQRIFGKYSERIRQIDILVKSQSIGRELIIVIDCKKFSKKINVKTVESFIGFSEDVGAHIGIMITNVGYSKSAEKRAKNHHKDIQLDVVEFSNFEDYEFSFDICSLCKKEEEILKGIIKWDEPLPIVENGKVTLIHLGNCSHCAESYVKCQGCGQIIRFNLDIEETECLCEYVYDLESEYVGNGLTEERLQIRYKNNNPPEFIDLNQTNLFN